MSIYVSGTGYEQYLINELKGWLLTSRACELFFGWKVERRAQKTVSFRGRGFRRGLSKNTYFGAVLYILTYTTDIFGIVFGEWVGSALDRIEIW